MKTILFVFALGISIVLVVDYYGRHPCIRSHEELVFHKAHTQLIPAGKAIIPIRREAYSRLETICDERK